MKFIPYIALTGLLALPLTGCDGFLEKEPLTSVTTANFYQTEEDALRALTAAYATLQFDGQLAPAGHFRWFWGDIVSDDADKGGSGPNDVAALARLEAFEGRPANELLTSEWRADYDGIYYANVVLEYVPAIDMDPFLRARILGEAQFIRAYMYYQLVTVFGGVPLVTRTLSPSEDQIPRATEAEIWAQIETDLLTAIPELPLKTEYAATDLGRITKGAAQGLLLKAYVWQQKWSDAVAVAAELTSSGQYSLASSYRDIFTLAGENGPESVFEIQYMNRSNGDWGRFEEGTLTNVFQRARGDFGGYGFNLPTQDLVDEFEPGDPRLGFTVFKEGDAMGDRGIFTPDKTGYPHPYYARKYFISRAEEAPTGDANVNGPSNDRVIRYADVLLLYAEAAYHTGNEGLARSLVNQVRARARGTSTTALPNITASGPALLDAIYHERRVELAMEGHRFFDLVRTGRAGSVMRALGFNFVDGVHEKFPIPEQEIQLSNGTITQNPGY
ncbi:MAG: RagB/SusD family nutrient uptake outer membrane protein [Bacteroidia bacterium]|nr:RagB/SusD family nutrient uptake outer membrane protein [Bacteroidia bacterium]